MGRPTELGETYPTVKKNCADRSENERDIQRRSLRRKLAIFIVLMLNG